MTSKRLRPPSPLGGRAVLAAIACVLSGAACTRPAGEAPAASAARKKPVIGAILMQQDQFFRLNERGMRDAARTLGADLRVQNAAGALDKEASIVETFTTQGVSAILVSPLSSTASIPALQRARERGIHVIT